MEQLTNQIEALLFAAGRPLRTSTLAELTGVPIEDVASALERLEEGLQNHGLRLLVNADEVELVSAPAYGELIAAFLEREAALPLSKPALETLAIVAQHPAITKLELETARGIASDQTLKNLLGRGLISVQGRPPAYRVTAELLRLLGVTSDSALREALGHAD